MSNKTKNSPTNETAPAPRFVWGKFLYVRHEMIHYHLANGLNYEQIGMSLSCDAIQVERIAKVSPWPRSSLEAETTVDGIDWELLQRIASGQWGRRTGALVHHGYLEGRVTKRGLQALKEAAPESQNYIPSGTTVTCESCGSDLTAYSKAYVICKQCDWLFATNGSHSGRLPMTPGLRPRADPAPKPHNSPHAETTARFEMEGGTEVRISGPGIISPDVLGALAVRMRVAYRDLLADPAIAAEEAKGFKLVNKNDPTHPHEQSRESAPNPNEPCTHVGLTGKELIIQLITIGNQCVTDQSYSIDTIDYKPLFDAADELKRLAEKVIKLQRRAARHCTTGGARRHNMVSDDIEGQSRCIRCDLTLAELNALKGEGSDAT